MYINQTSLSNLERYLDFYEIIYMTCQNNMNLGIEKLYVITNLFPFHLAFIAYFEVKIFFGNKKAPSTRSTLNIIYLI